MTLEEFEEKVKQIFIDRDLYDEEKNDWFVIETYSRYKDKRLSIYSERDSYFLVTYVDTKSENWQEAYEKALEKLNNE